MPVKQNYNTSMAPDGSQYVCITDGVGNLLPNPGNSSLSTLATAQVTVNATATQIAASRPNRNAITITNTGTTDVYIGNSGVTTTTGTLLMGAKGASITIPASVAIFGIASTGTQIVSVMETY